MESTYKEVKHCIVFLSCILGPWLIAYIVFRAR